MAPRTGNVTLTAIIDAGLAYVTCSSCIVAFDGDISSVLWQGVEVFSRSVRRLNKGCEPNGRVSWNVPVACYNTCGECNKCDS